MSDSPHWLSDAEQDLWRLMLATARKISRALDDTLQADSNLSTSEFSVLVSLSEVDGCTMRLRDLCGALEWDRSRTSHQVTRMEKRGLVSKQKSPGDARGVLVALTEDGLQRLEAAAPGHVESVRRLVFDHLDDADIPALTRFFQGVLGAQTGPGHNK